MQNFDRFSVVDAAGFLERRLRELPRGRGLPGFLSSSASASLAIMAEATLIDLPTLVMYHSETGMIHRSESATSQAVAQYIIGLRDGVLLNERGHIGTGDGLVFVESMRDASLRENPEYQGFDIWDENYQKDLVSALQTAEYRSGPWLSLIYPLSSNWYHWLIENVGRLVSAMNMPDFQRLSIIVPKGLTTNQKESLSCLGISPDRLVEHDGRPWICEELYLSSFGAVRASYHPRTTALLQRQLISGLRLEQRAARRLLISRGDARFRRISNQDELSTALSAVGFETIRLSKLNLLEQATLFAQARVIIAPHGAGLANLIFAKPGTLLIEILPDGPSGMVTLFHSLTATLGMRYLGIACPTTGLHDDFTVPVEAIRELAKAAVR